MNHKSHKSSNYSSRTSSEHLSLSDGDAEGFYTPSDFLSSHPPAVPLVIDSSFQDTFGRNLFFRYGTYIDPETLHSCIVVITTDHTNFSHTHLSVENTEDNRKLKIKAFVSDLINCWQQISPRQSLIQVFIVPGRNDGTTGGFASSMLLLIQAELGSSTSITFRIVGIEPPKAMIERVISSSTDTIKIIETDDITGRVQYIERKPFSPVATRSQYPEYTRHTQSSWAKVKDTQTSPFPAQPPNRRK